MSRDPYRIPGFDEYIIGNRQFAELSVVDCPGCYHRFDLEEYDRCPKCKLYKFDDDQGELVYDEGE